MKSRFQKLKMLLAGSALVAGLGLAVPAFAASGDCTNTTPASGITNGINCGSPSGLPTEVFGSGGVFTIIINAVLFLIGMVAVIMLIIGAVHYVTSGGDAAAVNKAKNTILYAIVGVVLSFMSYAIINFVVQQFANATK